MRSYNFQLRITFNKKVIEKRDHFFLDAIVWKLYNEKKLNIDFSKNSQKIKIDKMQQGRELEIKTVSSKED